MTVYFQAFTFVLDGCVRTDLATLLKIIEDNFPRCPLTSWLWQSSRGTISCALEADPDQPATGKDQPSDAIAGY